MGLFYNTNILGEKIKIGASMKGCFTYIVPFSPPN